MGTADALEQLIVDAELRKRMGEAGRKRVAELFTEEVFCEDDKRDSMDFRNLIFTTISLNKASAQNLFSNNYK